MLLISVFYLLFLGVVAAVFYQLPAKHRPKWILAASYFFYLTWQPVFLLVLIAVTGIAFVFGKAIAAAGDERRKRLLVLGVLLLLAPLLFFKYFNFVNETFTAALFGMMEMTTPLPSQPYLVPLGISFFTFQAISYVADVYRRYLEPEKKITRFAAYLAFFPTLLAGPIERARTILPQLDRPSRFEYDNVRAGLQLILWGIFKKIVIADRIAAIANVSLENPGDQPGLMIYLTLALIFFRAFCDFSAYSDIAVGAARILGIKLSKNFDDRVYAAPSREIFWQGWHRTLTAWMRDYVFLPLSHGVRSRPRLYLNVIFVYLLIGVWHGAAWGFVAFGLLNGMWLVFEISTKQLRQRLRTRLGISENSTAYYIAGWLVALHVGILLNAVFWIGSLSGVAEFVGNVANSNAGILSNGQFRSAALAIVFLIFMDIVNRRIPKNENFDAFLGGQGIVVRWGFYIVLSELILRYSFVFDRPVFQYFNY